MPGTLGKMPVSSRRQVGMTSRPYGPYAQGYTRPTMAGTKRRYPARGGKSQKIGLSSDWSRQLDSMKAESLVIADQHAAVNPFPSLVHTARHTMRGACTRSAWANRKEAVHQGMGGNWVEVVTR